MVFPPWSGLSQAINQTISGSGHKLQRFLLHSLVNLYCLWFLVYSTLHNDPRRCWESFQNWANTSNIPAWSKMQNHLRSIFPGKSQQSGIFDIFNFLKNYEIHSYLVFVNFVKSTPKGKSMIVTTFVPFQANHYSFIFAGLATSTASLSSKKRRVDPFVLVRQRSIAIKPFFFK